MLLVVTVDFQGLLEKSLEHLVFMVQFQFTIEWRQTNGRFN
jgi:hypothetical protein